jgi:hypothetical protein
MSPERILTPAQLTGIRKIAAPQDCSRLRTVCPFKALLCEASSVQRLVISLSDLKERHSWTGLARALSCLNVGLAR